MAWLPADVGSQTRGKGAIGVNRLFAVPQFRLAHKGPFHPGRDVDRNGDQDDKGL
jgi:hypothetical protein